jgi:hypothetical protein
MDITLLSQLFPLLKAYGVTRFKDRDLEIDLNSYVSAPVLSIETPLSRPEPETKTVVIDPSQILPEFLRPSTSGDTELFWSSPTDEGPKEAMPLTGDAPMGGG